MRLSEASPGYLSLLCVLRHLQSQSPRSHFISPLTPGSLPPALTFIFLNMWTFSCPYLPWPLSSICQGCLLLRSFQQPHTFCFLPLSGPLLAASLSVGIPSTQLPFSYPAALSQWISSLGFEGRLHADDLLVLNSSPDLPLNFSLISMATCLTSPSSSWVPQTFLSYPKAPDLCGQYGGAMELFTLIKVQ